MASFFAPEETQITVERLDGIPLLNFSATPENTVGLAVKGLFDFVLAAVLAVVLSPLLVAIAGAVRLSSPGPILSRQKRCGLHGREFTIDKLRTRVDEADEERETLARQQNDRDGPVFKLANDPRVTRGGGSLTPAVRDRMPTPQGMSPRPHGRGAEGGLSAEAAFLSPSPHFSPIRGGGSLGPGTGTVREPLPRGRRMQAGAEPRGTMVHQMRGSPWRSGLGGMSVRRSK